MTLPTHGLSSLLDHLATRPSSEAWRGWHIRRIPGGHNGLVYHATGPAGDLAVKFSKRDSRDRAGREFHALQALRALGLDLAPEPILLERERYEHPVVVQAWVDGPVSGEPPADDAGWAQLCRHYQAIHAVTPADVAEPLPPAVVTATCAQDALERVTREMARIPLQGQPAGLRELVAAAESTAWPSWPAPPVTLCRTDPNPLNLIRRPGAWLSVDWEASGWGDPAFEIGDLMAFPAYAPVPEERWGSFIAALFDPTGAQRVRVYYVLTLVWWAAVFARLWYEVEHGGEAERLVERPQGWREGLPQQYQGALERAQMALQWETGTIHERHEADKE